MTHHPDFTETISTSQVRKAIFSAVLAAGIALVGVSTDHLNRTVLLTRDQASNYWGYFHEKSLKERIYESELSFAKELDHSRIADLQQSVQRYQAEQAEIKAKAEVEEAKIANLLSQLQLAETAEVLLELAIILTSVSLVVPLLWLEGIAGLIGILGLLTGLISLAGLY